VDHDEHPVGRAGNRGAAPPRRLVAAAAGTAVAAYAWWAVALPPFSLAASLAVLLAGGVAVVAGARRRAAPPLPWRGVAPWVGMAAATGALQLVSYLQHPRTDHPTLSSLANAALDSQPARAVAFVGWLAAAVGLARQ